MYIKAISVTCCISGPSLKIDWLLIRPLRSLYILYMCGHCAAINKFGQTSRFSIVNSPCIYLVDLADLYTVL